MVNDRDDYLMPRTPGQWVIFIILMVMAMIVVCLVLELMPGYL